MSNPLSCGPQSGPQASVARARSLLAEWAGMDYNDVHAVAASLQANLGPTTVMSAQDKYKVPADSDFYVLQIFGFMRFTALASEPTSGMLGWQNLDVFNRWITKAQNCTVDMKNGDKNIIFTDQNDPPLGALMPPMGYPLVWIPESPLIIPADNNLVATFTLQDQTAAVVGNNTIYGVVLNGALLPKASPKR